MKKLFLDDIRIPKDAIGLVNPNLNRFYFESDWVVVRSYDEFINYIKSNGVPDFVSFDHDLSDEHYNDLLSNKNWRSGNSIIDLEYEEYKEKTGYECAKWLVDWCIDNGVKFPEYIVHSANPVGKKNIVSYLENAKINLFSS